MVNGFQEKLMKYRILIDDVWNFDESGYAIGIGQKSKVLVGVKKRLFLYKVGIVNGLHLSRLLEQPAKFFHQHLFLQVNYNLADWRDQLKTKMHKFR